MLGAAFTAGAPDLADAGTSQDAPFKISLAEWSLNGPLFGGEIDHLDFAPLAREHGIEGVEYVNQFFMDRAEDQAYLREMKKRADGNGVRSVLIMCDSEGALGAPDEGDRIQAVENHKKWVHAAKFLGCHSIRVNARSEGGYDEQQKLAADGLRRLTEFADRYEIGVIVENHGGYSSDADWLAGVMERVGHPGCGTLPDTGNFRIDEDRTYDSYEGVEKLMPFAKGVSIKPQGYTADGERIDLDLERIMRIVTDAGYHGWCGIEHGPEGREWEGITRIRDELLKARSAIG